MIDEASTACILSFMYLFMTIVVAAHQLSVALRTYTRRRPLAATPPTKSDKTRRETQAAT
jgi:hypothetical protein